MEMMGELNKYIGKDLKKRVGQQEMFSNYMI